MNPQDILQWIQIIQELLMMWGQIQRRSVSGQPIASAFPSAASGASLSHPILLQGALRAMGTTLFPKLPPDHAADAAAMVLDSGQAMDVQLMLNRLGAGLAVDGKWLTRTKGSVEAFQLLVGLPGHGWTDDATYAKLVEESSKPPGTRLKL